MPIEINDKTMKLHRVIDDIVFTLAEMKFEGNKHIGIPSLLSVPGIGKTELIQHKANEMGYGFIFKNCGNFRLEEAGGIPDIIKKDNELHTKWSIPEFITDLREISKKYQKVLCLLDDAHLAGNIQEMFFELFTQYSIKGIKIPDNIFIVLAGNFSSIAGAKKSLSAVINRTYRFKVEPDFQYWRDNFAIPNNIYEPILQFLIQNNRYFIGEENHNEAWASPRSWTYLSSLLKKLEIKNKNLDDREYICICASSVGDLIAQEFYTYIKIYKEFDVEEIYNTGKFKIPNEPAKKFPFIYAISNEFVKRFKVKGIKNIDSDLKVYGKIFNELWKTNRELILSSIRYITSIDGQSGFAKCLDSRYIDKEVLSECVNYISKLYQLKK